MAINQLIMAGPRSFFTLGYVFLVVVLPSAAKSSSNNSGVSHGAKTGASRHNVYNTYNTFCTGPNKKIAALLLGVKKELGEMRKEIQSLKRNNTTAKGKSIINEF